jgi:hypothetical protein
MPYILYVGFVVGANRGPVDYETFMSIGQRLLAGQEVYGENSYYPMPYVMVFAFFSWLPRPMSMALWLFGPVVIAAAISQWSPWTLLFAPVFGHCVGGQSAVFGMLGLWGYRRHVAPSDVRGGIWLGLMMIKPQLGLIPLVWAASRWWAAFRENKRLPAQAWAWGATTALIYLPGFLILPDWPQRWLSHLRPLFERALSGFVPRTLLVWLGSPTWAYWLLWTLLSGGLLLALWLISRRKLSLDMLVVWGFVVSPLVHDYDLIQLVPLLETSAFKRLAVLLSIPGWAVILLAYGNDSAWYWFTLIAPGMVWALLQRSRAEVPVLQSAA